MVKSKSDPTMLVVLAAIGIVGLLVMRRYGVVRVLQTANQALGIASVVQSVRRSAVRPARRKPARKVRPRVLGFSKPGS